MECITKLIIKENNKLYISKDKLLNLRNWIEDKLSYMEEAEIEKIEVNTLI